MRQLLSSLPVLVCPIGMGLMMWVMARGTRRDRPDPTAAAVAETDPMTAAQHDELRQLRAELDDLRASDRQPQQHP